MYKVEKMHMADIIDQTNLYLTPQSLCEIWNKKQERKNPKQPTGWEIIRGNDKFIYELLENHFQLYGAAGKSQELY